MSESNILVNDARVMSKGQVTIPKNIREALGVTTVLLLLLKTVLSKS